MLYNPAQRCPNSDQWGAALSLWYLPADAIKKLHFSIEWTLVITDREHGVSVIAMSATTEWGGYSWKYTTGYTGNKHRNTQCEYIKVFILGFFFILNSFLTTKPSQCNQTKLNSVALVRERTIPTERPPLVGKVVPTFADRGCCVVSETDSHGR
jgi:hypothetical protein